MRSTSTCGCVKHTKQIKAVWWVPRTSPVNVCPKDPSQTNERLDHTVHFRKNVLSHSLHLSMQAICWVGSVGEAAMRCNRIRHTTASSSIKKEYLVAFFEALGEVKNNFLSCAMLRPKTTVSTNARLCGFCSAVSACTVDHTVSCVRSPACRPMAGSTSRACWYTAAFVPLTPDPPARRASPCCYVIGCRCPPIARGPST